MKQESGKGNLPFFGPYGTNARNTSRAREFPWSLRIIERNNSMSFTLKPLVLGDLVVKVPIIQGGMGVKVSTSSLASAVANCGAAGTIASVGLGYGTSENETNFIQASNNGLINEIRQARKLTDGVIGVNIMVALSNYEELARTAARENIDFIVSGAGLPMKLPGYVDNPKIKLIPIVSSARAAQVITRTWKKRYDRYPDAVVVEGPLAGGHLGFSREELDQDNRGTLEKIIVEVIDTVKEFEQESGHSIPVIAAGGIYNGKDAARFFRLGVQGIQMATRFVATHECSVADHFKDLYLKAGEEDIVIIDSPVGMPGRAIKTDFIVRANKGERVPVRCNYRCLKTCNPKTVPYCIALALFHAVSGDVDNAVVFAGSNVPKIDKIVSVKELIDEIVTETEQELSGENR